MKINSVTLLVGNTGWVGLGKVSLDTLQYPIEWHCIYYIGQLCQAITASEETPDVSLAINDDGSRVTCSGECARILII
jgi:hypothetical protein